jgi:hypothetical protein
MIEIRLEIKGTRGNIIIKGSNVDEVLNQYESNKHKIEKVLGKISFERPTVKGKPRPGVRPATAQGRILSLRDVGFFEDPKTAEDIRDELKTRGHPYSIDRVSVALLRLVRKRQLRRLTEEREKKEVYVYVNP